MPFYEKYLEQNLLHSERSMKVNYHCDMNFLDARPVKTFNTPLSAPLDTKLRFWPLREGRKLEGPGQGGEAGFRARKWTYWVLAAHPVAILPLLL